MSQTTQFQIELGKIQGLISESADITTSAENIGNVVLENINESEPVELVIYPTTEDISYLYLKDDTYLHDDLYLPTRTVIFENTTTKEKIEYELPDDLLFLGNVHDEFKLDYNHQVC